MTMLLQTGVKKTNHFHIGTIFFSSFSQHKYSKPLVAKVNKTSVIHCTLINRKFGEIPTLSIRIPIQRTRQQVYKILIFYPLVY